MNFYKPLQIHDWALLLITVRLSCAAYSVLGAVTEGDYTYSITNEQATIVSFNPSFVGALDVTNTLGGFPVTCIGVGAFDSCSGLSSLKLPSEVAAIKGRAFYNCLNLTNLVMGSGVTNIDSDAFNQCVRLPRVVIPDAVVAIGRCSFSNCSNLSELVLGAGVRTVDPLAFSFCPALESVTFLTDPLSGEVSQRFTTIKRATIGDTVTSIGIFAFAEYTRLTNVTIGACVTSINYNAFTSCSALTSVTIPDSVKAIGTSAFRECSGMKRLVLGSGLQTIGGSAFENCYALDTVTFQSLPPYFRLGNVFAGTTIREVIIGNSVTAIGEGAFSGCPSSISIGNSVTNIGDFAFERCGGLTNVVIPDSVTSIGSYAFRKCGNLASVVIGRGVTNLGYLAFAECPKLTRVLFLGDSPPATGMLPILEAPATAYYLPGTTHWASAFGGRPTLCWNPVVQTDAAFGFSSGRFGFTVAGTTNIPVAVEACTNLSSGTWTPLLTGTLGAGGTLYFSDPASESRACLFYRIVWP